MKVRLCELCKETAVVFCPADAAFLCRRCDDRVHGANFLVARHVRRPFHATCQEPTAAVSLAVATDDGVDESSVVDDALSSSSSSACNSTTTTTKVVRGTSAEICDYSSPFNSQNRRSQRATEGVFADWYGRLGLGAAGEDSAAVVRAACAALDVCTERLTTTFLPRRVCLASALWLGLRIGFGRRWSALQTWKVAKRLEEISGVPSKVILAVGSKLERAARISGRQKRVRRRDLEEGWAESS